MKNTYDKPLSQDLISAVKAIVEQPLDELSKNTLGRYAQVAVADREYKMKQTKDFIDAGHVRKARGDQETADEYYGKAGALSRKAFRRKDGINKAIDKLTKEETEINELSRETHIAYNRRAFRSADKMTKAATTDAVAKYGPMSMNILNHKWLQRDAMGKVGDDYVTKYHMVKNKAAQDAIDADPRQKKANKRNAMGNLSQLKVFKKDEAAKKAVKEETEINELSKATLGRYIKAASGDLIPKQRVQDRQFNTARDYPRDSKAAKYHAGEGMKTGKKIQNRRDGIDKATDKLTAEPKKKEKPTLHGVFVKWHSGPYKGTEVAHGGWTKNKEKAQALADKLNKDSAGSHYSYHTKSTSR